MNTLVALFYAAVLYLLTCGGCATTKAIVTACAPPATDEIQAVTDLFERPDLSTAEVIAAAEGGKILACVITEIAHDVLAQASKIKGAAPMFAAPPPLVARAQAWLVKHP